MRGGGQGWREDSSLSSAVWRPWTSASRPLMARIKDVDGLWMERAQTHGGCARRPVVTRRIRLYTGSTHPVHTVVRRKSCAERDPERPNASGGGGATGTCGRGGPGGRICGRCRACWPSSCDSGVPTTLSTGCGSVDNTDDEGSASGEGGGWCPATSRCGISGRTGGENPVDIHR